MADCCMDVHNNRLSVNQIGPWPLVREGHCNILETNFSRELWVALCGKFKLCEPPVATRDVDVRVQHLRIGNMIAAAATCLVNGCWT